MAVANYLQDEAEMYCVGLSQMGFAPVPVITGDYALALGMISELKPQAVLTRLMPQTFGVDLTRAIRGTPLIADTPILILTTIPHREQHDQARAAGADAIYLLPMPPDRIAGIVRSLIESR